MFGSERKKCTKIKCSGKRYMYYKSELVNRMKKKVNEFIIFFSFTKKKNNNNKEVRIRLCTGFKT